MSTALRKSFRYMETVRALVLMLLLEGAIFYVMGATPSYAVDRWAVVLLMACVGGFSTIVLSIEVIREIRNEMNMHLLLMATILQFIVFFAVQYWLLSLADPGSYSGLILTPLNLLLQSTLIFVFNPTMTPVGGAAELLMLLNLLGGIAITVFVLQNIWQTHSRVKV